MLRRYYLVAIGALRRYCLVAIGALRRYYLVAIATLGRRPRIAIVAAVTLVVAVLGGAGLGAPRDRHPVRHTDLAVSSAPSAVPSSAAPTASPPPPPGVGLTGPLNILIAGVDTRTNVAGWQPHSDADMILHVTADLRHAYLFSLPRDLVVSIPAFPKAGFGGAHTKLTSAMSFGSHVPGSSQANTAQGYQLLSTTIRQYTGISRFDAGGVLTFNGLATLVDALGGIDMNVDQEVASIHMRPDGKVRTRDSSAAHGFTGPQAVYTPGMHHFVGWQALDYARQRYIPGSDYARQRHQRQLVQAIIEKAFAIDLVTNPAAVDGIARGLGSLLAFDGGGRPASDFAYVLRNIRSSITLVNLRGGAVFSGSSYQGEALDATSVGFFGAVRQDSCDAYLQVHPDLVNH